MVLRLRGGGKKRKKKQYTTPKKNKHKRKKEKLRVLKYYKVDDSGKITRLRKECPVAGPGNFMASHAVSILLISYGLELNCFDFSKIPYSLEQILMEYKESIGS